MHEVEVELGMPSAAEGRRILRRNRFRVARRRVFEANTVFDTPSNELRKRGELLRLRDVAGRSILTYKGPLAPRKRGSRVVLTSREITT